MPIPKVRVLIVENEAVVSMDLRYQLKSLGYCVTAEAGSGEEAVEAAFRLHPDVVLIDIWLNRDMDGVEAAEEIRRRFNIPVVYLTGSTDEAELPPAKATDPPWHLSKPFEYEKLRSIIEKAIRQH